MAADCPRVPNELEAAMAAVTRLGEFLTRVGRIFPPEALLDKTHPDLQEWLNKLSSQEVVAANLSRIRELRNHLVDAGFGDLIQLVGTEVPKEFAAETIRQSWLRAIWNDVVFGDPSLAGFNEGGPQPQTERVHRARPATYWLHTGTGEAGRPLKKP